MKLIKANFTSLRRQFGRLRTPKNRSRLRLFARMVIFKAKSHEDAETICY